MDTYNIHEAKTQLSKLVDQAVNGSPFYIAKAGKVLVKVVRAEAAAEPQVFGFLRGHISTPDDFNTMGQPEIASMFEGQSE